MSKEKNYLEMLDELYEAIEADSIPKEDKNYIVAILKKLHEILWRYSA